MHFVYDKSRYNLGGEGGEREKERSLWWNRLADQVELKKKKEECHDRSLSVCACLNNNNIIDKDTYFLHSLCQVKVYHTDPSILVAKAYQHQSSRNYSWSQ